MLSQLIHLLEGSEGEVDLTAISRALKAEPSAVSGMLETLVRKGRVIEVTPACGVCDTCGLSSQCVLPAQRIKRYQLVRRTSFQGRSGRSEERSCRGVRRKVRVKIGAEN